MSSTGISDKNSVQKQEVVREKTIPESIRIAVIFHRLGPYHIARLLALSHAYEVVAIELSKTTSEYQWDEVEAPSGIARITLFKEQDSREVSVDQLKKELYDTLDAAAVSAVFVNGWYEKAALLATRWSLERRIPAFVMSATTALDFQRQWWKEQIKKSVVACFSGALVGGTPHAQYIRQLGARHTPVAHGYDVVDNAHFKEGAAAARSQAGLYREQHGLPARYFLTSNRFMEKKNLFRLLEAYQQYRQQSSAPCDLVMLGDGELKPQLLNTIQELDIQEYVHLPGFRQYQDLPVYYGLATAFVHASTSEQWGLVVNEAMASGLPVIVSSRCGCAEDLVKQGVNGFAFDPYDTDELTRYLLLTGQDSGQGDKMGKQSERIIEAYSPATFREGVMQLVDTVNTTNYQVNWKDRVLGQLVIRMLLKL